MAAFSFATVMGEPKLKQVLVSAGHGGNDPGAIGGSGKYVEAQLALRLRDSVADLLRSWGVEVVEDGADDENLPLPAAIALVKKTNGPRVEFHFNGVPSKAATGVEALALPNHRKLAIKLVQAVTEQTGLRARGDEGGYKPDSSGQHHRLGFCRAGGVILEVCFISNPSDMKSYLAHEGAIAEAIADVLASEVGVDLRTDTGSVNGRDETIADVLNGAPIISSEISTAQPDASPAPVSVPIAPVAGGASTDAPVQASQGTAKSMWAAIGGSGLAALAGLKGVLSSNAGLIGLGVVCVTLLVIAIICRQIILDWLRMKLFSDPNRINVR